MFAAGFINRVGREFKKHGYHVRLRNINPHPDPGIYVPQRDLLQDVKWR
jgi:hypothetical protein